MEKINVVLADDHVLVRKGIKAMLESDREINVIGEANDGEEALESARKYKPDIMVLDIRMPRMDGLTAASKLSAQLPNTKCVILSMHDSEEYVIEALNAGAYGYILKDTDGQEFIKALKQVYQGTKYFSGPISNILAERLLSNKPTLKSQPAEDQYHLTKREKEILAMIAGGKHNKDIAEALDKSIRTIETHRFNIMKKLGVNNAVDMVNLAVKENLV